MEKINDTTYKYISKDDPKDRIEVEIGDLKQPDLFYPLSVDNDAKRGFGLAITSTNEKKDILLVEGTDGKISITIL